MGECGHLLDQLGLVDLIRQFGHNDSVTNALAATDLIDHRACAHLDDAAPRPVCTQYAFATVDKSRRRKVRPGNDLDQRINADRRFF